MSALDELSQLVRTASETAAPSVVGIGRHGRGSGFVVATGPRADQRPQPPRPHHPGALQRRPDRAGRGHRQRRRRRPRRPRRRHRGRGPARLVGTDGRGRRRRRDGHGGPEPDPCELGPGHRGQPFVPRSPRPPDRRCRRAHRAGGSRLVRGAGSRRRRPGARREHAPPRPRLLPRPLGRSGAA